MTLTALTYDHEPPRLIIAAEEQMTIDQFKAMQATFNEWLKSPGKALFLAECSTQTFHAAAIELFVTGVDDNDEETSA